jgi:hypothetical protein
MHDMIRLFIFSGLGSCGPFISTILLATINLPPGPPPKKKFTPRAIYAFILPNTIKYYSIDQSIIIKYTSEPSKHVRISKYVICINKCIHIFDIESVE